MNTIQSFELLTYMAALCFWQMHLHLFSRGILSVISDIIHATLASLTQQRMRVF